MNFARCFFYADDSAVALTLRTAAPPSRKPFLNFLVTVLRYRMRPVPVVFLLFPFSLQFPDNQRVVIMSTLYIHFRTLAAG